MVMVYALINVLWLFVWHFFTKQITGYRLSAFLKDVLPFALTALFVAVFMYGITLYIEGYVWLLLCRLVGAMVLYVGIMYVAKAQILSECVQFVLQKIKKK